MGILDRVFSKRIDSIVQDRLAETQNKLIKAQDAQILSILGCNNNGYSEYKESSDTAKIEVYSKSIWVYGAVYTIASSCAGIKIKIYKKLSNGERGEEIKAGDVYDIIYSPNEEESYSDFFEKWYTYLELTGDNYCFRNKPLMPDTLWIMRPDCMEIVPGSDELVSHYEYSPEGCQVRRLDKENVIHIRYLDPRTELYGQSATEPAEQSIIQDLKAVNYVKKFFENGGAINMYAHYKGEPMGDVIFKRIKQELKNEMEGERNHHKIPILENVELKALGAPPKDMMLDELKDRVRDEILSAYGVPPIKLGYLAGNETYNNAETQEKIFWENMVPKMRKTTDKLNKEIFYPIGYECEYDLASIQPLQADEKKKAEVGEIQIRSGQFKPNEVRDRQYNADPVKDPEADKLHIKTNSGNNPVNTEKSAHIRDRIQQYLVMKEEGIFEAESRRETAKLTPVIIERFKSMEDRVLKNLAKFAPKDTNLALILPPEKLIKEALKGFSTEEKKMFNDLVKVESGQVKDFAKSNSLRFTGEKITSADLAEIDKRLLPDVKKWGKFSANVVTKTQSDRVAALMKKAIDKEMPFRDIQKGIQKIFEGTERADFPWSRMIARTETGKIGNATKELSIKQAGFKFKQWVHSGKHDSRHEHVSLGKRKGIPLNTTFNYTNDDGQLIKMQHPHDPTAPPSETVNCGCTIIPYEQDGPKQ